MQSRTMLRIASAALLAGTGVLAACDAPAPMSHESSADGAGPSLLTSPGCAGTAGQSHAGTTIRTSQKWTRATSPHRVSGDIYINTGGLLTIEPGVVVCVEPGRGITAVNGGRVYARGRDTARIVFTARDAARGWNGLRFEGSPASPSYLTNVRVEHVQPYYVAVSTNDYHGAYLDSAVIRQSGSGVELRSPGSRFIRSRVDTTTNRNHPAVMLANGARFEQSVVRRAAGVGVRVFGPDVLLSGGRVEGSGGVGLLVQTEVIHRSSRAVRVVGGRSYGGEMPLPVLARLYPTPELQDSIRGNARDTLVVTSGELRGPLTVRRLPLLITSWSTYVDSAGVLTAQPGASFIFRSSARIIFDDGGRLVSRGNAQAPVVFTADDPTWGWDGLIFQGPSTALSYITNTRIEHTGVTTTAVVASGSHRVLVDSSVFRWVGRAVYLTSLNSRLYRTRVDTTLDANNPAVTLGGNVRIESTRIRGAAGPGLYIGASTVVVASCEIRDGDGTGILMTYYTVPIRNCNLVNNAGPGIENQTRTNVDAKSNWWGSSGGPSGAGGDGAQGPTVFTPWRTAPYALQYVPSF